MLVNEHEVLHTSSFIYEHYLGSVRANFEPILITLHGIANKICVVTDSMTFLFSK